MLPKHQVKGAQSKRLINDDSDQKLKRDKTYELSYFNRNITEKHTIITIKTIKICNLQIITIF